MDTEKKYVLCPGSISSLHDANTHFVDAPTLAKLYGVSMEECYIIISTTSNLWQVKWREQGLIFLYPRTDGNYRIPKRKVENG